jgi:uncharacterized protein (TIRG00374 family)
MSKVLKYLLGFSFGLCLFYFVVKSIGGGKITEAIFFIFSLQGLILFLISIVTIFVAVLRRNYIFQNFGAKISFKDVLQTWFINFALNYFTPVSVAGGEIPTILILQKKFNIDSINGTSVILIDEILNATLTFFSILVGMIIFAFYGHFPLQFISYFIGFITISLLILLLFFYSKMMKRESFLKWFFQKIKIADNFAKEQNSSIIFAVEENLINFFDIKKISFWKGFLLSLLREILLIFRTGVLIVFLTGGLELQKVLVIYALENISSLFPTPAALGSFELMTWLGFASMNFAKGTSLTFALAQRFIDIILSLTGLTIFIIVIFELIKEKIINFFERIFH